MRITKNAFVRVVEPPTLHLLAAAACMTLSVGAVEGAIMCQDGVTSWNSLQFVGRYSLEQLFPSVVWASQDPHLVAKALQLDPATLLKDLSGSAPESASLLLKTQLLTSSRHFWAGLMMIGQLLRAATITMDSFDQYKEQVKQGREPPLFLDDAGLVVRLCGVRSHVSEVSLQKMGTHLFPVLEDPDMVQYLVQKHSLKYKRPVYWRVLPDMYGASDAWEGMTTDDRCFLQGRNEKDRILVLEADATNGNDPLALTIDDAMDLNIDDAAQGFRRILDRYIVTQGLIPNKDFRTLRVYLGNSMETQTTGGGHSFTMRHRVQYAKEVDVLIDSRAPVLKKILDWCHSVAFRDRKIFFQTSSRDYFLNLQKVLKWYGYEIYDPLDVRIIQKELKDRENGKASGKHKHESHSFLHTLLRDKEFVDQWWDENATFLEEVDATIEADYQSQEKDDAKRKEELLNIMTSSKQLPTLIHMRTTAETVNAVEALVMAGEVDARNCCALIDRHDGVQALERTLKRETQYVREEGNSHLWSRADKNFLNKDDNGNDDEESEDSEKVDRTGVTTGGLQIVCSSSIHDDLFRQVRQWARMGYTAAEIQAEFDARYQDFLQQIYSVQQEVKKTNVSELHSLSEPEPTIKKS